jgi:hypothetical protein
MERLAKKYGLEASTVRNRLVTYTKNARRWLKATGKSTRGFKSPPQIY